MNRIRSILTFITVTLIITACSSSTTIESDLGIGNGAPDWVNEGTQAVDNDDGRFLHGVGVAPSMNDFSLQKSAADNRARAEIARILSTYIDSTISDYTSSVGDSSDMSVAKDLRGTSQLTLSGARILGYWKNDETGDIYAFAELDLKAMDEMVESATTLSDAFKRYYAQNGNAGFDRFKSNRASSNLR